MAELRPIKVAPIAREQINEYGSSYPFSAPVDPPPPVDLVSELVGRGITVTDADAELFRNETIWTDTVKDQLKTVLDDLEARGVRYEIDYDHTKDATAVTLERVTLKLVGP